ncbi:MAG: hypothetical protein WA840_21540, partial [Caulobacteraceae bacterium]
QHALALLTLDPSSADATTDGNKCFFSVRDGSGVNGAWVNNKGSVQISRKDLGTNAAALRFQHDQSPFLPASNLVKTADPTDRVVLDSRHPDEVWAVHGPYYVELNAEDETPAARAHPTWAYRLQRTALEAAGATIIPQPGQPADPAVPVPRPEQDSADGPRPDWTPPAHPAPAVSVLIDPVLHLMYLLAKYRFFVLPLAIFGPLLLSSIMKGAVTAKGRTYKSPLPWLLPLCIVYGVLNLVVGTGVVVRLINSWGVSGAATITGTYPTGSQYNNHDVVGYKVLIRTPSGKLIDTRFEDDDFNVYPPHNATTYPDVGSVFTVRYLQHFPKDFAILANDGSPWATAMRCSRVNAILSEAEQKAGFSRDPADQATLRQAMAMARAGGC